MPQPTVSVVIPAHNSSAFIVQAIQSVLDQTYGCHEVVVVDDGSTDTTGEVLHGFGLRVTYVRQNQQGPSAARNAGIRRTTGDYVCFLDADDVWLPEKIETQLQFANQYPQVDLIFADAEEFEGEETVARSLLERTRHFRDRPLQPILEDAFMKLLVENFIPTSTVMVRRTCLGDVGLFDEALRVSEDRDLWTRIAARFQIGCVRRVLARKRVHRANISSRSAELTYRSRIVTWQKSRRQFPHLASGPVVDQLLAQTYLQLGYLVLYQEKRKEALSAALNSLKHAVRACLAPGPRSEDTEKYSWRLGAGLVAATLVGYSAASRFERPRPGSR